MTALRTGIPREQKQTGEMSPELARLHEPRYQTREERALELAQSYAERQRAAAQEE